MRLLILEEESGISAALHGELAPLGHSVTRVPRVENAQVALQAEDFDAAVLSARLLAEAAYSLVDYIRITRPGLRILLVRDTVAAPDAVQEVDWVLTAPASALEIVQVTEYLLEEGGHRPAGRNAAFTYAGVSAPAQNARRGWLN